MVDRFIHLLKKHYHSLSVMKFSHSLLRLCQFIQQCTTTSGWGSTMWEIPLSMRNLNSRVGTMHKNELWKSSWNIFFILSNYVLSSISYPLQKSSTIFSNHSNRVVWASFERLCSSNWSSNVSGFIIYNVEKFLEISGDVLYKFLMNFNEELSMHLFQG